MVPYGVGHLSRSVLPIEYSTCRSTNTTLPSTERTLKAMDQPMRLLHRFQRVSGKLASYYTWVHSSSARRYVIPINTSDARRKSTPNRLAPPCRHILLAHSSGSRRQRCLSCSSSLRVGASSTAQPTGLAPPSASRHCRCAALRGCSRRRESHERHQRQAGPLGPNRKGAVRGPLKRRCFAPFKTMVKRVKEQASHGSPSTSKRVKMSGSGSGSGKSKARLNF